MFSIFKNSKNLCIESNIDIVAVQWSGIISQL